MPYRKTNRRPARRPAFRRRFRRRRGATHRPRKALSTGYKGVPNIFRFSRETAPVTLDLGVTGSGVTMVPGSAVSVPNMAKVEFAAFQMADMPGMADFINLYANIKLKSITTYLMPLWSVQTNSLSLPSDLLISRVNSRYLTNGWDPTGALTTSDATRAQLAQIVKKSRSRYSSKRSLKLVTKDPLVWVDIPTTVGGPGTVRVLRKGPWLPCEPVALQQEFSGNSLLFADSINGADIPAGVYKYRVYHRCEFECSFIG